MSVLLVAILDGVVSSLMTCHPITGQSNSGTEAQKTKEYCTALHGPILVSLQRIAHAAHKYEGLITAAFTLVLAAFTGRLWWSTDKLWGVTDAALKSTERSLEATERAYIFHGYDPIRFRTGQATLTLRMINAGRMPGHVTGVGFKFLERPDLPKTREEVDWVWEKLDYDFIVRPGQNPEIRTFLSLAVDHVFVCYIQYEDLFTRKTHTSWMGMHINAPREEISGAGGKPWNDWD